VVRIGRDTQGPHCQTAEHATVETCTRRGVQVRPLRQMDGGADFNEVFLSDVRIPTPSGWVTKAGDGRSRTTR